MIVSCPHCQAKLDIKDQLITRPQLKIKCPKCQTVFTLPPKPPVEEILVVAAEQIVAESCRIITICNQKGGVAKTSTCVNLGASLAASNYKVLLVDFDVLANLTLALGYEKTRSFYDVLKSPNLTLDSIIKHYRPNLALLPSSSSMNLLPKRYLQTPHFERLLSEQLLKIKHQYDFILIDTPPSMEFFTLNALMAADWVIIPAQCEYFSMNGVAQVENIIARLNTQYARTIAYKILVTMYDHTTAAQVILNKLKAKYPAHLLSTRIDLDPKIPESQIINVPVLHYAQTSTSAQQYLQLAKEISHEP